MWWWGWHCWLQDDTFEIHKETYRGQQYSQIYYTRLHLMRTLLYSLAPNWKPHLPGNLFLFIPSSFLFTLLPILLFWVFLNFSLIMLIFTLGLGLHLSLPFCLHDLCEFLFYFIFLGGLSSWCVVCLMWIYGIWVGLVWFGFDVLAHLWLIIWDFVVVDYDFFLVCVWIIW